MDDEHRGWARRTKTLSAARTKRASAAKNVSDMFSFQAPQFYATARLAD
jgi:hypothetical protein